MDSPESGDGRALERSFAEEGVVGRIEARGRLAVFTPGAPIAPDARVRRRLVALARQHGFANVAIELLPDDASLSRD
jgi:hypothetical protein